MQRLWMDVTTQILSATSQRESFADGKTGLASLSFFLVTLPHQSLCPPFVIPALSDLITSLSTHSNIC